jgi:RNA polymerase sigma factor (sigma-70 family)
VDSPLHVKKERWSLTQQAFDNLLHQFAADRDEAAKQYERLRLKLVRFFEWRALDAPEECADETIDRVARRLDEGKEVNNIASFSYGVARKIFLERLRLRETVSQDLEDARDIPVAPVIEKTEPDERLECFDQCLDNLPEDRRSLIIDYYQDERRAKIELRNQLAERLDIPLNALRIRVHRIRSRLESCVDQCLKLKD